tara:strand:- start:51 stop:758 length:708 start_codon:yes stop_codon:yes gene_type:complete
VPGSAIVVELSNVYFQANAPADASDAVAELAEAVALLALAVALLALAVALVAAAVAELAAAVADVDAADALVVAVEAEPLAPLALEAAAVALEAAAVADVVALAASTINAHLAASVLLEIGCEPLEVCTVIQIYILLLEVSLTISRNAYAVEAAQLPVYVPISWVAWRLPEASKDSSLLALVAALSVIVTVPASETDSANLNISPLIVLSNSCRIKVSLSSAASCVSAGKLSFST